MSSGSESDEEFVPGEPEQLSEEDSADEETDLQYENEQQKAQKRKASVEVITKKKRKTQTTCPEPNSDEKTLEESTLESLDPEEQKKKDDELWAKFLEGTDSKPSTKTVNNASPANAPVKKNQLKIDNASVNRNKSGADDAKARERRIFEFAGETIVVEDNVIKEKTKTAESPAAVIGGASRSGGGGLSNVLGQLNRKSKLSTLEKSKLDWDTFKKDEGIEEEIQSHNKGKHGYLDRQDFLERADVRQYEIERDLRMSRRSNR